MVQLEFNINDKPKVSVNPQPAEVPTQVPSSTEEQINQHTPIMIGEVEFLNPPKINMPAKTMDWIHIRRIAMVQMFLSFIAIICITVVVFTAEMNRLVMWSKTALFSWALFLLCTAYAGYRSSARNYCQVVAYFVMSIFQTMINGFWLALLFLAACYVIAYRDAYNFDATDFTADLRDFRIDWNTGILVCELVESLCLFGTVFTGLLGAFAGCKGFGRILQHQDSFINAQQTNIVRY